MVFKLSKTLTLDAFYKVGVLLKSRSRFLLLKGSWKSAGLDASNTSFSSETQQFSFLLLFKVLEEVLLPPKRDQECPPLSCPWMVSWGSQGLGSSSVWSPPNSFPLIPRVSGSLLGPMSAPLACANHAATQLLPSSVCPSNHFCLLPSIPSQPPEGHEVKVAWSCPTLCNPIDYTIHGIRQARTLEWVAFPFSRASY